MIPRQKLYVLTRESTRTITGDRKSIGRQTGKGFGENPGRTDPVRTVGDVVYMNGILLENAYHEIVERPVFIGIPDLRHNGCCRFGTKRIQLQQSIAPTLQAFD